MKVKELIEKLQEFGDHLDVNYDSDLDSLLITQNKIIMGSVELSEEEEPEEEGGDE